MYLPSSCIRCPAGTSTRRKRGALDVDPHQPPRRHVPSPPQRRGAEANCHGLLQGGPPSAAATREPDRSPGHHRRQTERHKLRYQPYRPPNTSASNGNAKVSTNAPPSGRGPVGLASSEQVNNPANTAAPQAGRPALGARRRGCTAHWTALPSSGPPDPRPSRLVCSLQATRAGAALPAGLHLPPEGLLFWTGNALTATATPAYRRRPNPTRPRLA